jgi:hypothetical protein
MTRCPSIPTLEIDHSKKLWMVIVLVITLGKYQVSKTVLLLDAPPRYVLITITKKKTGDRPPVN